MISCVSALAYINIDLQLLYDFYQALHVPSFKDMTEVATMRGPML